MNAPKTSKKMNWFMLFVIASANIAAVTNVQGFKALFPFIEEELALSRAELGLYSTFYFFSAALVSIFAGKITDTLGSRRGILIGLTALGFLMILHSLAPELLLLLILGLLSGFAFSLITPSGNKGVMQLTTKENRGIAMGMTQAGGGVGGVLGALILPVLGGFLGWRVAVMFSGGFALLVALFIAKYYHLPSNEVDKPNNSDFRKDFKYLLKNNYLLSICIIGFLFGATMSSVTTHLPLFITQDIGLSKQFAGIALALFQFGGVFGHPSWGYINDKLLNHDRRLGLFLLGLLITLVSIVMGISPGIFSPVIIIMLPFVLGFVTLGIPGLYYTTLGEVGEDHLVGTATGLGLIFIRTGNFVAPPLFGLVADIRDEYTLSWFVLSIFTLVLSVSFFWLSNKFSSKIT